MVEQLGESLVWQQAIGLGSIKTWLEAHGDVFDLEENEGGRRGEVHVSHPQRIAKPEISDRFADF